MSVAALEEYEASLENGINPSLVYVMQRWHDRVAKDQEYLLERARAECATTDDNVASAVSMND